MSQGKSSDLNKVGGNSTLVNTVGENTKVQLDAVAINSGIIIPGGVNTTNAGPVKETRDMDGNDNTVSVDDAPMY